MRLTVSRSPRPGRVLTIGRRCTGFLLRRTSTDGSRSSRTQNGADGPSSTSARRASRPCPRCGAACTTRSAMVRRLCASILDHLADEAALVDLVAALDDEDPGVLKRSLHALACDRCKENECRPGEELFVPRALELLHHHEPRCPRQRDRHPRQGRGPPAGCRRRARRRRPPRPRRRPARHGAPPPARASRDATPGRNEWGSITWRSRRAGRRAPRRRTTTSSCRSSGSSASGRPDTERPTGTGPQIHRSTRPSKPATTRAIASGYSTSRSTSRRGRMCIASTTGRRNAVTRSCHEPNAVGSASSTELGAALDDAPIGRADFDAWLAIFQAPDAAELDLFDRHQMQAEQARRATDPARIDTRSSRAS